MSQDAPAHIMDSRFVDEPSATGNQRFKHDDRLYVVFDSRPVFNQWKSNEAQRPIYDDTDYITIRIPGNKLSVIQRPVRTQANMDDRQRFPKQWENYKAGKGEEHTGTPLKLMPWLSASRVAEYTFLKMFTVEALANANDEVGQNFMGFQADKQKAMEYMDAANRGMTSAEVDAQLATRDEEIEALKAQVALLAAAKAEEPLEA